MDKGKVVVTAASVTAVVLGMAMATVELTRKDDTAKRAKLGSTESQLVAVVDRSTRTIVCCW